MTHTWALFAREVKRFQKIWLDTVLSPIVSIVLYFSVFGFVVGDRSIGGMSYLVFIYTGLLAMNLLNSSFSNPAFALIIAKNVGTIADLQVIPLKPWKVGIAYALAAVVRSIVTLAIAVLVTVWFVPGMMLVHPFILLISVLLIGLLMGMFGVIIGMYAKNFEALTFMTSFVLQPLMFFSGVFYPVSTLPGVWAKIAMLNPIHHMINLIRYSVMGYADADPLLSFGVMIGLGVFLFILMQIVTNRYLRAA
jgi:ABC-2 type transport system permease protein